MLLCTKNHLTVWEVCASCRGISVHKDIIKRVRFFRDRVSQSSDIDRFVLSFSMAVAASEMIAQINMNTSMGADEW